MRRWNGRMGLAAAVGIALAALSGCQGSGFGSKRSIARSEPGLGPDSSVTVVQGDSGSKSGSAPVVVADGASSSPQFIERHPLFSKPKEYYDSTDSNKFAKTASAAFIGVPAGIVAEVKQAFRGKPKVVTPGGVSETADGTYREMIEVPDSKVTPASNRGPASP